MSLLNIFFFVFFDLKFNKSESVNCQGGHLAQFVHRFPLGLAFNSQLWPVTFKYYMNDNLFSFSSFFELNSPFHGYFA